jgi:hypothetical protein
VSDRRFDHSLFGPRLLFRISDFDFRDFFFQFLLQMLARGFLDGAAFGGDGLFFGLTFLSCPCFHGAGEVRNLWAVRAYLFLSWFGVRLHRSASILLKGSEVETSRGVNFPREVRKSKSLAPLKQLLYLCC